MPLLELRGLSKHFGAIQALTGVDLTLEPGEMLGLMGDNGAGKSTLIKIIAGNFPPDPAARSGSKARTCISTSPVERAPEGIEVVYQDLALCDNLTAAANVFLGREAKRRVRPVRLLDYAAMYRARRAPAVRRAEIGDAPARPGAPDVGRPAPGGGDRAHAARRSPSIVLMDEPTAAISVRQVAEVLDLIRRLRDQGIAVILISHRMPDVFAVCDRDRGAAPRPQGRRQADRRRLRPRRSPA